MFTLVIIGLLVAFIGYTTLKNVPQTSKLTSIPVIIGGLMIAAGLLSSIFVVIDPGKVGVKTLFGKVSGDVLTSGLKVVNPLMDITEFDIKTQNYTMSQVHDEGEKQGDDAIRILSKDGLEVILDLSVLYTVIPSDAPKILSTIGNDYREKVIRPLARTRIRDNAVYYDAVSLFSNKRDEFQNRIFTTLEKDLKERGIKLEQLLIRNIVLPATVKATIESKINAEQEAQKMEFVLQKEKQEAERKRVEAQGIADYQRIINTGLSDKQLQYEMIKAYKELATSENSKVIVLGGNGKQPIILGQ
ncbi:MAG: prohibitin family protein [Bacteroidia bacterium]|nr:prohibitin family protein [Bacteroidia bacterium]